MAALVSRWNLDAERCGPVGPVAEAG